MGNFEFFCTLELQVASDKVPPIHSRNIRLPCVWKHDTYHRTFARSAESNYAMNI